MSQKYLRYDGSQWILNNGTSGPPGPPGAPGATGIAGPPGPTGPAGSSGSGSGFIPNRNRNENYFIGQMYIGSQFKQGVGVFQDNQILMTDNTSRPARICIDNTITSISEETPNIFGPSVFVARAACNDIMRYDIQTEDLQSIPLADSSATNNISDVISLDGYIWALDKSTGGITKIYSNYQYLDKVENTIYLDPTFTRLSPARIAKDATNNRIIAIGSNQNGPTGTSPLSANQIALYKLNTITDAVTISVLTVPDADVLPIDLVFANNFYWIMYRTNDESTIKIVKVNATSFAVISTTTFGTFSGESDAGFATLRANYAGSKIFTFTNDGYVYRMDTTSLAIDNFGVMTQIGDLHHNGTGIMWVVGKDQGNINKGYAHSFNSTAGTMIVIDTWEFNKEHATTAPNQPNLVSITCNEVTGYMYIVDDENSRLWQFDGSSSGDATDRASLAGIAKWVTSPTIYSGDNLNDNRTLSSNRGIAFQSKGDVVGGVNFGSKDVGTISDDLVGDFGTIGGGLQNSATFYSTVPGGGNNTAGATGSIAMGVGAKASRSGQSSFSSGSYLSSFDPASSGKIQACEMVFCGTGNGGTGFNIELKSGMGNTQYLTLENEKTYNFTMDCTAKNGASTSGAYYKKYVLVHIDAFGAITIDGQGDLFTPASFGSGGYTMTVGALSSPTRLGITISAPIGTHSAICKVVWIEI